MVIESVQRQLDDCEMLLNREVQVLSSHRKRRPHSERFAD